MQLTNNEIQAMRELMPDYTPGLEALDQLEKHNGNMETAFQDLWREKNGAAMMVEGKSLWDITLKNLRNELCGDDGFRGQIKEYTKNPGSSPLLTGLIVSLVSLASANGLPLDPAIATVIVLYILKIGVNIFCDYTEPPTTSSRTLPPTS
ncbi:hypothetical protein VB713_18200 [Anabaena cylindrica UHCC 0172]|uniref:hypothetical protein n=1 Tax=Anabaena cylindrica TaxID=1165 RepID=UPI002B1FB6D6|nr:hypothetical protein [Anabaena cylindrica]MEA5552879.1 hypothetical protein [Anabaena cylindrica UHCC 0172]